MDITANCPHCQSAFTFDASQVGQQGTCPTCQAQIALKVPVRKPQAVSPSHSPSHSQTPKTELEKIRAGTRYKGARGIIRLLHAVLTTLGVCSFLLAFASGAPSQMAIGISAGAALIAFAAVFRECGSVVFDIADALISQRGKD